MVHLSSVSLVVREMWLIAKSLPESKALNGAISFVVGVFSALMGIGYAFVNPATAKAV